MTTTFHRLLSVDAAVQRPREENQEAVQLPAPTEPLTGKKKTLLFSPPFTQRLQQPNLQGLVATVQLLRYYVTFY